MVSSLSSVKQVLRTHLLRMRAALPAETAASLSRRTQEQVLHLPEWQTAQRVGLYSAIGQEVGTSLLLEAAWAAGKQVFLPRCLPSACGEGMMEFVSCPGPSALVPGFMGILEPDTSCTAGKELPELLLVPVVGLSPSGFRIGYGKGYYDRLLARPEWKKVLCFALLYPFQLVPFQADVYDQPLQGWVSATEVRRLDCDFC